MQALTALSITVYYAQDVQAALGWIRLTGELATAGVPGWATRMSRTVLTLMLTEAGELDDARQASSDGLARSREVGDVVDLATLLQVRARIERLAGSRTAATSYLQETAQVATRTGDPVNQRNCVEPCDQVAGGVRGIPGMEQPDLDGSAVQGEVGRDRHRRRPAGDVPPVRHRLPEGRAAIDDRVRQQAGPGRLVPR
jgi:hypothetical protein